jgi:vacuolar-type H+-ATPase subunit E/Vma4
MALADLLEVLRRDADARATALVTGARDEAARMIVEAESKLARHLAEAVRVREGELRTAAAAEIESARREAMRDGLVARAEALARIFARARTLLATRAADPALGPQWARDIAEARSYMPAGEVVVRQPPEIAGLLVTAADGSVGIDATIEALLTRLEPALAIDVARELEMAS